MPETIRDTKTNTKVGVDDNRALRVTNYVGSAAVSDSNRLPVDASLTVSDIEIGAVEIKNHNTDDRVEVDTDNAMKTKLSQGGSDVDSTNPLPVDNVGVLRVVSSGNSSTTPLSGGATFTGSAVDTTPYSSGMLVLYSDVASAVGGIEIESSHNGSDWTNSHNHTYQLEAGENRHIEFSLDYKYVRIVYTNGGTGQTTFNMQTIFNKTPTSGHIHPIDYVLDDDHPASVVRNINVAKKPGGDYININATSAGNLKMSVEELETAVEDFLTSLTVRNDLEGNGYVTIGTSEVELTYTGTTNTIHLESKSDNTGTIWIGKTGVTNSGGNSLASLSPGESIDISYDDSTNAIYAISDTASQSLLKGALL